MVTNNPVEALGPLSNPLMGFRPDLNNYHQYPYPTVVRQYIRWNQIENNVNDTVQKIRDFCNAQWANLPTNNIKVIPRIYVDWDSGSGNEYWPADLTSGDWTSQQFKDRVVRLVGRLGEVWDNDPRVAWVQTGIIGYWGEQENPVGISQDGWAQRMGDAFTNAFHNKKLVVRNMNQWPGYEMGVYWDSFGHPSQSGVWNTIRNFNNQGRYLTQVVEGEVAYNWGETTFDPLYGGEPEITLNNANYTDNMIDVIRELHCSALGWIASYKADGSFGTNPDNVRTNAARMQKEFGYRFHITEFSCSARTEPGGNLDVRFKVKNTGSAPFYENWPVAVVLINETTRQMVWKATLPNVDIRTWQPGTNYSNSTRTYQTPAQTNQVTASVPVPSGLATGQYLVGLTILEPMSLTPGIFFAVTNFFKQSQSQPLCRIGIGVTVSDNTLAGVAFDNLVNDDARYYTLTNAGPFYTLTVQPFTSGCISLNPTGGSYVTGTTVTVTATGNLGYGFSSWGGDLAGSTNNPAIVVMETNKSISANFVSVPTYTLTTNASNGWILLSPPGGIYSSGTVVTVTATPSIGYTFGSWSGNLMGSTNPATITMNGDRSLTANFNAVVLGGKNVLLVVADASNMGPADTAILNRLQGYGCTVPVVNDELVATADAAGKDLVLTSSTVGSGSVNTKFRDVAVPVVNWETFVQDDYRFTGDTAADRGNARSQTTLNITNPGHPLAGGLPAGIRTVATASGDFSWGEPGGSPTIIARLNDGSNHPCLYAYETNAAMTAGTAPARRVHLFLQNETFASLNADGLKLFDAAVGWAMGQALPISFQPPYLQGGQLRLEWLGGGTLQTTTNVLGPWSDVSGAVSPYLTPTTNSAQFFRVKQ